MEASKRILNEIRLLADRLSRNGKNIRIMTFCGTHEYVVASSGLRTTLPDSIELIAGPGCPVCVTPAYIVDQAIELALEGTRVYTYGDAYMLPGIRWLKDRGFPRTLREANGLTGNTIPVYSVREALYDARKRGGESVFLAIGFETTAPATVLYIMKNTLPQNFSFLLAHRLTPPIMKHVIRVWGSQGLDGIIAPGHVSTITGATVWSFLPTEHGIPVVVSGFTPQDILESILHILRMLEKGKPGLVNQYSRVVSWNGNPAAQEALKKHFEKTTSLWRGIGWVPESGLSFREKYIEYDASHKHSLPSPKPGSPLDELPPNCRCAEITLGLKKPTDCPLFMKSCRPSRPYGPCMVSREGTCNIWARTGERNRDPLSRRGGE